MQIEKLIINALKGIGMPSKVTPILADRDGVEPEAPYLIIQMLDVVPACLPTRSISHSEGNVTEKVFQTKTFYTSLTFHASATDDLQDWIHRFQTGLMSDMYDWAFTQQGLGIVNMGNIMYQSYPVDNKNYKRAIIDIAFRAEIMEEFVVNAITGVQVIGKKYDPEYGEFGDITIDVKLKD